MTAPDCGMCACMLLSWPNVKLMRIYPDTRQITALIHYCQIQYQTLNMNFRCRKQHDDD